MEASFKRSENLFDKEEKSAEIKVVKAVVNGEITEAETIELTEEELPV